MSPFAWHVKRERYIWFFLLPNYIEIESTQTYVLYITHYVGIYRKWNACKFRTWMQLKHLSCCPVLFFFFFSFDGNHHEQDQLDVFGSYAASKRRKTTNMFAPFWRLFHCGPREKEHEARNESDMSHKLSSFATKGKALHLAPSRWPNWSPQSLLWEAYFCISNEISKKLENTE